MKAFQLFICFVALYFGIFQHANGQIYNLGATGDSCEGGSLIIRLDNSVSGTDYKLLKDGSLVETKAGVDGLLTFTSVNAIGKYTIETDGGTKMNGYARIHNSTPDFTPGDTVLCVGTNKTILFPGSADVGGMTYNWVNTNTSIGLGDHANNVNSLSFTPANTGTSHIVGDVTLSLQYKIASWTCNSTQKFTLTVLPQVVMNLPGSQTVCKGTSTEIETFSSSSPASNVDYQWSTTSTNIGMDSTSGIGNIPVFTGTNGGLGLNTANFTVNSYYTLSTKSCPGNSKSFSINVIPEVIMNTISNQTVCKGANTAAVTMATTNTGGTMSYSWVNSNTTIGYVTTNGIINIPVFAGANTGTDLNTSTFTVTPTYTYSGTSCAGSPTTFTINVIPQVDMAQPVSQVICEGTKTKAISFSSPNSGGTMSYAWHNSNTGIGYTTSDSIDIIPVFTGANTGTSLNTATFTVTPEYNYDFKTCSGTSKNFTINVIPQVEMNLPVSQIVCKGTSTKAINFSSSNSGGTMTYAWHNDNTSIGYATSDGTGSIPIFSGANAGTSLNTATYTVIPKYTYDTATCSSAVPKTFTINVIPQVIMDPPASQVVCKSINTKAINFSSSNSGGAMTYDWHNNNINIGYATANGTGNIPVFAGKNTGNSLNTATFSVTPKYTYDTTTCSGTSNSFTINVIPQVVMNSVPDSTFCNNTNTSIISFSSSNAGSISYLWENPNTSIGLAALGNNNIPSFTATNSGNSAISSNLKVTPKFTYDTVTCSGGDYYFNIYINPSAQANLPLSQVLCNKQNTVKIKFTTNNTDGATSYSWTNSAPEIGLAANGNDSINSFTAINTSTLSKIATIDFKPFYYNHNKTCVGNSKQITIKVNPTPIISFNPASPSVCAEEWLLIEANPTGSQSPYTHQWSGLYVDSLTSSSISKPSFRHSATGSYLLTYKATDANNCSETKDVTVSVSPATSGGTISGSTTLCAGTNSTQLKLTGQNGNIKRWEVTRDNWTTFSTISSTSATYNAINIDTTTKFRVYVQNPGCAAKFSDTATITINPRPIVSIKAHTPEICASNNLSLTSVFSNGTLPYKSFTWIGSGLNRTDTSVTTFQMPVSGNYTLSLNVTDNNNCTGAAQTSIKVNALPIPKIIGLSSVFSVDQNAVNLVGEPASGIFLGKGVFSSENKFYPKIADINTSGFYIKYIYTDPITSCTDSAKQLVKVYKNDANFAGFLKEEYCSDDTSFLVTIEPKGSYNGTFSHSKNNNGLVVAGIDSARIYPSKLNAGYDDISFKYEKDGGEFYINQRIYIDSVGVNLIFENVKTDLCLNSSPVKFEVFNAYPAGGSGHWSASALLTNTTQTSAYFNPTLKGKHTINYTYESPKGCLSSTISKEFNTIPLPSLKVLNDTLYNAAGSQVKLLGNLPGGEFTGSGIIKELTNYYFKPDLIGTDKENSEIYYANDSLGCKSTVTAYFDIFKMHETLDSLPSIICYNTDSLNIKVKNTRDKSFLSNFNYKLKRNPSIIEMKSDSLATIYPKNANFSSKKSIKDTLVYSYKFKGLDFSIEKAFSIDYVSQEIIVNTRDNLAHYCVNSLPVTLEAKNIYPSDGTHNWIASVPDSAFSSSGFIATLIPSKLKQNDTTVVSLTYNYTSPNGCKSQDYTKIVSVHALPQLFISNKRIYSTEEPTQQLVGRPSGGIFKGKGTSPDDFGGYTFSPNLAGEIKGLEWTYTYADPKYGCSNSISKIVNVFKPNGKVNNLVTIGSNTICHNDGNVNLVSNIAGDPLYTVENIKFFGTGVKNTSYGEANYDTSLLVLNNDQSDAFNDTIRLEYEAVDKVDNTNKATMLVKFPVYVEKIGTLEFEPLNDYYCFVNENNTFKATLDKNTPVNASVEYEGSHITTSAYSGTFNPIDFSISDLDKDIPVTLKYTSKNGCKATKTKSFRIVKLPEITYFFKRDTFFLKEPLVTLSYSNDTVFSASGTGIKHENNKYYLDPSKYGETSISLNIFYKDSTSKCSNNKTQKIEIVNASASFSGINDTRVYCSGSSAFNISVNSSGIIKNGFFETIKGLNTINSLTAHFRPDSANLGLNPIVYHYTNTVGTPFFISTNIDVKKLKQAVIMTPGNRTEFCPFEPEITLDIDSTGGTFTGDGIISGNKFLPFNAKLGSDTITYTYSRYSCSSVTQKVLTVKKVATLDFTADVTCFKKNQTNEVVFKNNSSIPPGTEESTFWTWDFGDTHSSTIPSPTNVYASAGQKIVRLNATTDGCSAKQKTDTMYISEKPTVDFDWDNECYDPSKAVKFTSKSSISDNTTLNYNWKFFDSGSISYIDNTKIAEKAFDHTGEYKVRLTVTAGQCSDSLERNFNNRPIIPISSLYLEDFETSNGGWYPELKSSSDISLWKLGTPSYTNASGNNSWYTQLASSTSNQYAYITSPCYNFSNLHKPMISVDIKKLFESGDGVVLQYRTSSDTSWQNMGTKDAGKNWFNSSTISSLPGGQKEGWTSEGSIFDNDWMNAVQNLDILAQHPSVRFRFAIASRAGSSSNGFLFDNFKIKERSRVLLLEHFTNIEDQNSVNAERNLNELNKELNVNDYLTISYHKNKPNSDPFYDTYPSGTNTKMFDYDFSSIPYSVVNGGNEAGFKINYNDILWNNQLYANLKLKVLENPAFYLKLTTKQESGKVSVHAMTQALRNFNQDLYTLQIALVEKEVTYNSVTYKNILRRFIPNAGGTNYERSWAVGDSVSEDFSWTYPNTINKDNIRVIAYIQNETTKEVYQVTTDDPAFVTGTNAKASSLGKISPLLYPNPAISEINILFEKELMQKSVLEIYNNMGRMVLKKNLEEGHKLYQLNIQQLPSGCYFFRINNNNEFSNIQKLIKMK